MPAPRITDWRDLQTGLRAVHEQFVAGGIDVAHLDFAPLSPVVAQSWQRSIVEGVSPDGVARQTITGELAGLREAHPLTSAMPVIRQLLIDDAAACGVVIAVVAEDGTLLWVEGDRKTYRRIEEMNFVPGADWSERGMGTNAPGTALALDRPVQIRGAEHFCRMVQPWSCTAAPIHDRHSGALIGAIDVTGGSRVVCRETFALVRATAVAVENQLALVRFLGEDANSSVCARLTVLGAGSPHWMTTDDNGHNRMTALSGRHAEILVLLSRHPEGLTADHLAMLLDEQDLDSVTVRAEMSRLRKVIGGDFVDSRPYRLCKSISSDLGDVLAALDSADLQRALSEYRGALLPRSQSPAIRRLRTELSTGMRAAVLASGDMTALRRWLDLPEGRDDRAGWQLLQDISAGDSVARARARGYLAGLDSDLG